nr:MAG TPA: cytochrome C6 [Caudoviricetes sp.]
MASLAGLNGIAMPQFGDKMDPEDARALKNYLYQLTDQLEYVLTNLSSENMNEEFLKKVEK